MSFWGGLWFVITHEIHALIGLTAERVLFVAIVISIIAAMIALVRRNLPPNLRSWLWALCIPALVLPFGNSAVILGLSVSEMIPAGGLLETLLTWIYYLWHFGWFAGMLAFAVHTHIERRRTIKLIRGKRLLGCAAYFYRGRSHIYLPSDFTVSYTEKQREMLLAHEKQHIAQHDPLIYRMLQIIQCVFWFCPPVHKAVRLLRQDRELLCDRSVMRSYGEREYGELLLYEAKKSTGFHTIPCLVSETGDVYERITACVKPFSNKKMPAVLAAGMAVSLLMVGVIGLFKPMDTAPTNIRMSFSQDNTFSNIDGAERFIVIKNDGIALDQQGLMQYAAAQGLSAETGIDVSATYSERITATSCYTVGCGGSFFIGQLETEELFFPYYDSVWKKLWGFLYRII